MKTATWDPATPAFNSIEDTRYGNGALTTGYTENVDTRHQNKVVLGPEVTVIDCGAAGGTAANTNGFALSGTINALTKLFAIRGTKWAKIRTDTMALLSDDSETALAEAATDIIYTNTSGGTQEISVGMAATAYRVITTANDTATDTHSANDDAEVVRIFGLGWPADRIIGLSGQTVKGNVLTGSVTMDNPTWSTIATLAGEAITPTGFARDGKDLVLGTSNGPYMLDSDFNRFRPIIDEIDPNSNHGKGMATWYGLGVVIPLADGTRFQKYLTGRSIGPETYPENSSPIQGRCTAVAGTNKWLFLAIYNEPNDDTYICACRPSTREGKELDFYPLIYESNTSVDAMKFIGTALEERTNPTMVYGHEDDVAWFTIGRLTREIDDTNYRFTTSGTWYGTEMRRSPDTVKIVRRVRFESSGCNASGENLTVNLRVTDERGQSYTEQIGAVVTGPGMQILRTPDVIKGWRIRPEVTFASNTNTASPAIEGMIHIDYDEEPVSQDGLR